MTKTILRTGDKMKSNKEIIEKIEFSEGNDLYLSVKRLIHEALQIQKEDIFNEIQLVIDKYNKVLDNYEYKAEVNSRKIDEAIVYNLIKLKQKLEEKDGKTNT